MNKPQCSRPITSRRLASKRSTILEYAGCALWCLVAHPGCSTPYEPDGQFWSSDNPPADGGSGSGAAAATSTGGSTASGVAGGGQASVPPSGGSQSGGGSAMGGSGSMPGASGMGGTPGAAGASTPGGAGAASENCSLKVAVTTSEVGGKYKPANIGAIWVADAEGKFVRTLEVWAARRINHLNFWNDATSAAGVPRSRVDIVSQATYSKQKGHTTHTATWACRDFGGKSVPDGTYRVYFEVTDKDARGASHFVAFAKSGAPSMTTPAGSDNFHDIQLVYTP